MFKLRLVLFAALALASTAFMPAMPATKAAVRAKPLFAAPQVNILTQADKCLGGECSVDDVSELLVQIRVQIKALKESTAALEQLEGELSGKNTGVATDQVKALIKAVLLALNVDPDDAQFPKLVQAAGFSGEPFKGKVAEGFPTWKKA